MVPAKPASFCASCFLLGFLLLLAAPSASGQSPLTYTSVFGGATITATAVDREGNVYLAGSTTSRTLPTTPGAFQTQAVASTCGFIRDPAFPSGASLTIPCRHGFVAKVDPSGARLLYLTYLGGSREDSAGSIAIDSDGQAYVAGYTSSPDFPVDPKARFTTGPGFLLKLSADGGRAIFSTRLPGPAGPIALDASGNIYVSGGASDIPMPVTPNAFQSQRYSGNEDIYLLKLNPDASSLVYCTLLGGTFADRVSALVVDSAGQAYLAGLTASTAEFAFLAGPDYARFPTTPGAFSSPGTGANSFLVKFNADASALVYSSVFGGSGDDYLTALAVDSSGVAYFSGSTFYAPDFPITPNALKSTYGGAVLGKLSADGSRLLYSSYMGSARSDRVVALTVNSFGKVYIRANFARRGAGDPCLALSSEFYGELSPTGTELDYSYSGPAITAMDSAGHVFVPGSDRILQRFDSALPAPPALHCVTNAAVPRLGRVAPGEVVSLFGFRMNLGGGKVLVNGLPATVIYESPDQINAVIPFGVSGATRATIVIDNTFQPVVPLVVEVVAAAPEAFTASGFGSGQAAALNEDGSYNSPENPADAGSVITLWYTGFGLMSPPQVDGAVSDRPVSTPQLTPEVRIGSSPAEILYCGNAPGLIAGVVQLNVRIPRAAASGVAAVQVFLGPNRIAGSQSATIAVR